MAGRRFLSNLIPHFPHRLMVVAVTLLAGLLAGSAAVAQTLPYDAVVTEKSPIRAGAGESFYVVGSANQGDRVTVDEVIFGWYKIVSPAGTHSYIARQDVEFHASDNTAVVTSSRAAIKAAGLTGPDESYRRQIYLLKADTVQVVAQEGDYYKIVPPNGAYVFLPPNCLIPADQAPRSAPTIVPPPPPPAPSQPVHDSAGHDSTGSAAFTPTASDETPLTPISAPRATDPTSSRQPREIPELTTDSHSTPNPASSPSSSSPSVEPTPSPAPQLPRTPMDIAESTQSASAPGSPPGSSSGNANASGAGVASGAAAAQPDASTSKILAISPAVRAVEQHYEQVKTLPIEQQPIRQLLDEYSALANDEALPEIDQRIVAARIAHLQRNLVILTALRDINSAKDNLSPSQDLLAVGSGTLNPPGGISRQYDAVGRLVASSVYNGTNLPLLFRVVEPGRMRTVAYVRPGAKLVPAYYLERNVGIVGRTTFDPMLKMEVIDATAIDLLDPKPIDQPDLPSTGQTVNAAGSTSGH